MMATAAAVTLATLAFAPAQLRPLGKLGGADHGWLNTKHHFSFADYYDPRRMEWGSLRVWNDDDIAAGTGFPTHPHKNFEIITYVREGAITHKDTQGNQGRTEAGNVQVMSAGSGISHSEYNRESTLTRIFQIWIQPDVRGGEPTWGSKVFPPCEASLTTGDGIAAKPTFAILASGFPTEIDSLGALPIRAEARLLAATIAKDTTVEYTLDAGRVAYLVPAEGSVIINEDFVANARDGVAFGNGQGSRESSAVGPRRITLTATSGDAKVVMVDARE